MTVFELYNLYIGDTLPDKKWSSCDIGPFQVEMVSNYDEVVKKLYHPAKKIVIGLDNEKTSYIEESKGEWVITAIANLSNSENTTKSILARYEIDDNGLWDLCTILTFLTGRPVVTSECLERYVLKSSCARACIDIETLIAAKLAWEHRSNLVSQELVYALLLYNEAITQGLIQILSYCYNTSLNILLDETNSKMHEVSSDIRQNLKKEIIKVIDSCNGLDITQKSAYNGLLSAKIGYLQSAQTVFWGFSAIVLNTMVGQVPVIPSMYLTNASGSKAIYFLDLSVVEMRVLQDLTYEDLAKTNDSQKFMLKIYETLIIKNTAFNSWIGEISG